MFDTSLYEIGVIGLIRKKMKKYEDDIYFISVDGDETVYELFDNKDVRRNLRIMSIMTEDKINDLKNNIDIGCIDIIDVFIKDEQKYLTLLISSDSAKLKYDKVSIDITLTDDNAKIYCAILDIFVGYSNGCL